MELLYEGNLGVAPVDASVYRDLRERSGAEQVLTLRLNPENPLPNRAAEDAAILAANSSDARVIEAAFQSLGHAETAADLTAAIQERMNGLGEGWAHNSPEFVSMAQALARCGSACASFLEQSAAAEDPALRALAQAARDAGGG